MKKIVLVLVALGIFALAAFFRLYGVNWDQGQHLHPDERFLTMVTEALVWPINIVEYLDASISPLNPHNKGYGFFVYGTFPVFFTKLVTDLLGKSDYGNITLVGRQLSALFDLGTVLLVFLIAKTLGNNPINTNKYQSTNKRIKLGIGLLDNWVIGLFAAFFYAASVLPIQLSHFYAVDTYLTFFITCTFYLCVKLLATHDIRSNSSEYQISNSKNKLYILNFKNILIVLFSGVVFGLAIGSKITALLFTPIILLTFVFISSSSIRKSESRKNKIFDFLYVFLIFDFLFLISCYITVRFAQPYLFLTPNLLDVSLNQKVIDNWKQLKSFDNPDGGFPPGVQWMTTKSYIYPVKNILFWGLGLPMGLIGIGAVLYSIFSLFQSLIAVWKRKKWSMVNGQWSIVFLSTLWIAFLFAYQGNQFAMPLRYFVPIFPFLAVITGYFIVFLIQQLQQNYGRRVGLLGCWVVGLLILMYPLAFMSIYSKPITRVAASYWIYKNVPVGSFKSDEHWDDALPLSLPTEGYIHEKYKGLEFPLYWPDTDKHKWDVMLENLKRVNYIILTSNRLYGSLMTVGHKYPITYRYYTALFEGTLGFVKQAEFTSRPKIPIPFIKWCITPPFARYGIIAPPECNDSGISFVDDYADETFTVYDHPKVIIFKKVKEVDYMKILQIPTNF